MRESSSKRHNGYGWRILLDDVVPLVCVCNAVGTVERERERERDSAAERFPLLPPRPLN